VSSLSAESHLATEVIALEKKHSLFELKFKGVQIYPFLRMPLYYKVAGQLSFLEGNVSKPPMLLNLLLKVLQSFWCFIKALLGRDSPVLILEHPRKVPQGGEKVDIYTRFASKFYGRDALILKDFRDESELIKGQVTVRFDFAQMLAKFLARISIWLYVKNDTLNKIVSAYENEFPNLDLKQFVLRKALESYYTTRISKVFLYMLRPKAVVVAVSYSDCFSAPIVYASKELSISTFEVQHGCIGGLHLGYHYPDSSANSVGIFPDFLLLFGEYWKEVAKYPVSKDQMKLIGFDYFKNAKNRVKDTKRRKQIVFISQQVISERLLKVAIETAINLPDFKILFKLHPKQYHEWSTRSLEELNKFPENLIVLSNSVDLYQLLSESELQVGVFSTAIYEGIGLGLKTVVVKLPGWEIMKSLASISSVSFADNVTGVLSSLKSNLNGNSIAENKIFADLQEVDAASCLDDLVCRRDG